MFFSGRQEQITAWNSPKCVTSNKQSFFREGPRPQDLFRHEDWEGYLSSIHTPLLDPKPSLLDPPMRLPNIPAADLRHWSVQNDVHTDLVDRFFRTKLWVLYGLFLSVRVLSLTIFAPKFGCIVNSSSPSVTVLYT